MQAEIVHAQSCHLQETRVIDFGRDCEKSSSMTPYEWICQLMSRDGSVQKQSGLYQTMTPIFCYSHLKTVNLTCV